MTVTWKREYEIGVDEIDRQHQQLFNQFDLFLEAIDRGRGDREVEDILNFLKGYVVRHFKAEEGLQRQFGYPHMEMHLAEHRAFEKQLNELVHHQGPTEKLVHLTRSVLIQWLIQHICKTDAVLADFINRHRNEEWERWLRSHF